LILLSVLIWVPLLHSDGSGENCLILPFLAAHPGGVPGRRRLRARAAAVEGRLGERGQGGRQHGLSRLLIDLGVLTRAPYFY